MEQASTRRTESILPISQSGWDEGGEYGDIQFYNVEFNGDFGPFKAGDKVPTLLLAMSAGVVQEMKEDGEIGRTARVRLAVY